METEKYEGDLITIYILNKAYQVPDEATIMQAVEFAGYQYIRGCGCRGGVCGACAVVYRLQDCFELVTGLACQTKVMENMRLLQLPYFPTQKAIYDIEGLDPTLEQMLALYPEIENCMGCNTCTKSCPMEINVMGGISELLKGSIETVSKVSVGCTMCGLCAARCPVGLTPFLYFLLARRMDGRHIKKPFIDVGSRVEEVKRGIFDEELDKLVAMAPEALKALYQEAQKDKRIV